MQSMHSTCHRLVCDEHRVSVAFALQALKAVSAGWVSSVPSVSSSTLAASMCSTVM